MHIEQIIVLGEDLSTPWEIHNVSFVTDKVCGVYIQPNSDKLEFTLFRLMHFYGENKQYIEKEDILSTGKFWFKGKKVEVESPEDIDFRSIIQLNQDV